MSYLTVVIALGIFAWGISTDNIRFEKAGANTCIGVVMKAAPDG